jgi:flagellar hook-associated protein 3 FlgL
MSTRITDSMISRSVLSDLTAVDQKLSRTQRKMSSGKELTRPSDDPFLVARAMTLRSNLEATKQYQRNVSEATSWSAVTETALSRITDSVQRARELLVQAGSDSSGPVARQAIAVEMRNLLKSVKQEANATYAGNYVFSGTATGTRPYDVDGGDTYSGDPGAVAREIGPGVAVTVNVRGDELLGNGQGAADNKLLDVLKDIVDHLDGPLADPNALRTTDLQRLDDNLDAIIAKRAEVGATVNRLETAESRLLEVEESATKLLSDTEDADMAKTLIDFSMQQSVYQSALKSGANIIQASLLDFLR